MKSESISAQARQYKRHETAYKARIEPHPDCADQFRLSYPDSQSGLEVIDVSAGGLGLRSAILIPKNIRLTLHVAGMSNGQNETGTPLKIRAIARRVRMIDYKPTYQIGLQFLDPAGADEKRLVESVTNGKKHEPRPIPRMEKEGVAVATGGQG